jgi:hypothetical protein
MTGGSTCSDPEAHDGAVYAEHNLTRANLERAGFASYGEAREAAGFARGSMRIATTAGGRAACEHTPARGAKVVTGQVYLMRYGTRGNDYKISISDTVGRREPQLDMMSSSDVRKVHVIETGDPRGIEAYWHERFKDRRVNADSLILPRRANSSRAGYGRYVSCTDV